MNMAPTICLPSELSVHNNNNKNNNNNNHNNNNNNNNNAITCNNLRRRGCADNKYMKNSKIIIKEKQRVELKRILNNTIDGDQLVSTLSPPASPVWEPAPTYPGLKADSFLSTENSTGSSNNDNDDDIISIERRRLILSRREGLLDIVARTMALVRRSHMLQKRVNALRYETREFIRSVLNNPENNAGRQQFMELETRSEEIVSNCGYVETTVSSSSSSLSSSSSSSSSAFSSSSSYAHSEVVLSSILSSSRPITPPPTPDSSTPCAEYIVCIDDKTINERNYENSNSA